MFKHWFMKLYLVGGLLLMGLFSLVDATGGLGRRFGPSSTVDASSRQGYWYVYKKTPPRPTRSPGGYGGGSGGGYSGGK